MAFGYLPKLFAKKGQILILNKFKRFNKNWHEMNN